MIGAYLDVAGEDGGESDEPEGPAGSFPEAIFRLIVAQGAIFGVG